MLNGDVEWLSMMAEALARAVKYDSVALGTGREMQVIQISNSLAIDMARRLRLVARHINKFSMIEKSQVPGSLLAPSNSTSGPGPSTVSLKGHTDASLSPPASSSTSGQEQDGGS